LAADRWRACSPPFDSLVRPTRLMAAVKKD
jgi:hypothetical protein